MCSPDEAVVARQYAVVDAAEAADVAAGGGGEDDVAVVLVTEEDNGEAIVRVQEMHGEAVVGGYNSGDYKHHIDCFGKANAVDTRPLSETDAERGAE